MKLVCALTLLFPAFAIAPLEISGTWKAVDVHFSPWIFKFHAEGGKLTGTVQQASFDPPTGVSTTLSKPTEIYMGTITGDTIFFKVDSPGKHEQRTVTFTGSVEGDKIFFQRTPKVFREGDPGLNGIYGINGARQFTAVRVAPKSGR
jgi:hypothetical protein